MNHQLIQRLYLTRIAIATGKASAYVPGLALLLAAALLTAVDPPTRTPGLPWSVMLAEK